MSLLSFFNRYRPEAVGELSKISLGDALFDVAEQEKAKNLSPILTIESGVLSGTHVVTEEIALTDVPESLKPRTSAVAGR
jgi:hypothetical protein